MNQYLRVYTSYMQDDWVRYLPLAEFSYNNSEHLATGFTPFYAYAAFNPKGAIGKATGPSDEPNKLAEHISTIAEFLKQNLTNAVNAMKRSADKNRREAPEYNPGDKVLLSTKNITTSRPKPKWADKWIGPYKVLRQAHKGSDAYVLDRPSILHEHSSSISCLITDGLL